MGGSNNLSNERQVATKKIISLIIVKWPKRPKTIGLTLEGVVVVLS